MVDRLDWGRNQGRSLLLTLAIHGRGQTKGGQSSLADYYTYFVAYSDGSCTDTNNTRAPDRMLGEIRGTSSRCMALSVVRTGFVWGSMTQGNGCYQHLDVCKTIGVYI